MRRRPRPSAGLALAAILAGAAALRLTGIRYGLPFPLLDPDEGNIVPRAWAVVHGGGLDPHWYDYPSLLAYVLAPFQAWQAEPSYLAARLVVVALALAGVAAAWWLGRRAYGTRAALTGAAAVAVATTHVAYSHVAVTDVPLALAVACALALAVSGRLEWAGVAAGLAASVKYPGLFLAVPLVVAGWGRRRRLGASLALAAGAYALTSPYTLIHAGAAWGDASRVQRLARQGWLGFEHDGSAPVAFLDRLWGGLGPALVVAGAGLAVALARRSRADLVLVSFGVVYFADLLTLHAHFDRYVLPLVPVLGVLAGRTRALAPLALAALVVPLAWSIGDVRNLTRTDTRIAALPRIEALVPAGARVAADPSTPPLAGREVVRLELPGPGRPFDPRRDLARLRAEGVRWVLVTGAVTDRVLAARDSYPRESRFYDDLSRSGHEVLRVEPGGGLAGPWVALYDLDSSR